MLLRLKKHLICVYYRRLLRKYLNTAARLVLAVDWIVNVKARHINKLIRRIYYIRRIEKLMHGKRRIPLIIRHLYHYRIRMNSRIVEFLEILDIKILREKSSFIMHITNFANEIGIVKTNRDHMNIMSFRYVLVPQAFHCIPPNRSARQEKNSLFILFFLRNKHFFHISSD